jgi:hypothetical protein
MMNDASIISKRPDRKIHETFTPSHIIASLHDRSVHGQGLTCIEQIECLVLIRWCLCDFYIDT